MAFIEGRPLSEFVRPGKLLPGGRHGRGRPGRRTG
jgi:hypothetical protein